MSSSHPGQKDSPSDAKPDLQVQQGVANTLLTHHPVVVQLSLIVLFLWAQGLQSKLQLLPVQRMFDA